MTNHSTALRETTYLGSKDGRRSPFFSPPKKLLKVFAKSTSLDSLPPGPSSRPSGRPSTASSAETSTTSSRPSPSPVQAGQNKSKSSKVTSPRVVSSILNGMYAYPTNPQVGSFLSRSTRRTLSASPFLNNIPDVSTTISLKKSLETRSQFSVGLDSVHSSQDSEAIAEIPDPSPDTKSQQVSEAANSSIPPLSDYSAATAASHGSEFQASTSNISHGSTSSSSSTSTLRVVGRGGSGSRLRLVTPAPENLDPARLRQDHLLSIRPIGRGGLGSRPKPLEASSLPTREALQPEQAGHQFVLIRPVGRGGLGSRQKPLKSLPALPTIWTKRSLKGKEKETVEPRTIHPISPHQSRRTSGGTMSTISSIHFVGESDHPAYVSPFSPTNESRDSVDSDRPVSRPRSLSGPSLPSFTFPASQSTSATTVDDDGEVDGEIDIDDVEVDGEINIDNDDIEHPKKIDHRQKSLGKLTRTLGDIPPDVFDTLNSGLSLREGHPPLKLFIDRPIAKRDKNTKPTRRSSLSLTSLSSMFARPSNRRRDSVASHQSVSTITDDLHQFRMEDDFSERWKSRSDFIADSGRSPSPESPIMFAPPSPAPARGLTSQNPDLYASVEPEQEDDTPYVPSPTLSRSFSYTPLSRRRSAIASHNHSASASLLTVRSDSPALTPNWMIPPSVDDEEVVFALTRHVPEKAQVWTGEWNGDLQHVIKSLRTLR